MSAILRGPAFLVPALDVIIGDGNRRREKATPLRDAKTGAGRPTREQAERRHIDYLADLLRRPMRSGTVSVAKPEIAATAFLSMGVGGPLRAVVWGKALEPAALEARFRFCVRLFLDGARRR